ncbi:MAG: TonB-dependent receptor, partial [Flavobacteriaceae bacterium]|nr:TonB-dependent receptor [Flavobacteriaceae bacterium]
SLLERDIGLISLSDHELNRDEGTAFNISGLLHASRDVFLTAAAYDFSSTFFRPRGLDNAHGKVLINGIEMNKQFNGRPQWGNWGGLNDVQRNREFSMGLKANDYAFGGVAGTTNINMRASHYRQGGRVSYATSNRTYRGRVMATYSSGISLAGWAYSISAARRYGEEGFVDGTAYNSNSFFASVEKKLNENHSLNLTAFYTPNTRGRSTAITKEVRDLKGIRYNPNWGYQEGAIRNSRIREIKEPVVMLNHYWVLSENTRLNTNLGYQFGTIKNSRIDNNGTRLVATMDGQYFFAGGARNPLANYYQRLPSYFLRFKDPRAYDYQLAYQAQRDFVDDGQLNWDNLYLANTDSEGNPLSATYIVQNDVIEDTQFSANTIFTSRLNEYVRLNGSLAFRNIESENYAEVKDLLGSSGYLDIDSFTEAASEDSSSELVTDIAQSDLQNPNRVALLGERYKYNYNLNATSITGFLQAQFKYNQVDFYLAATAGQTKYQRIGLFENGNFPGAESLGASEKLSFTVYGAKGGAVYKVTGRHLIDLNAAYFTKAPSLRNSFTNARQNNEVIIGLKEEKVQHADLSYIYRSPIVKARLTGYYNTISDQTDLGFYFTENISGLGFDKDAFVQEVMTEIATRRVGAELGIEAQVTPTVKLKGAGAYGVYTYTSDPKLYLRSDDFEGALTFGDGRSKLKNYHVPGGPERAYQLGLEYRDPEFWWVGISANYFSNAYIDVNNLARTSNFTSDFDGQTFNDYDEEYARELLRQEEFDNYVLVNIVGGKSWRINNYYVGFFATINNAFDEGYRTGGFEQGRNTNFRTIRDDRERGHGPVFGNRYFFGNGTTYYVNAYVRF